MISRKTADLLVIFRVIEGAKDAIEKFEQGEINAREAVQLIVEATALIRAA